MTGFEKVKACLKALEYPSISVANFEDKLVVQKIIYLLQLKGVRFGYRFSLYVRGPYSPDLTKDLYTNAKELARIDSKESLVKNDLTLIRNLPETINLTPSRLEVAATYAYFAFERNQDPATATASVRRMKGFYPESQIALGISGAKRWLYAPTESELREIASDAEPWGCASELDGRSADG